ncbi:MAG: DUF1761 domain-containing protein [Candidatus Nanopelagicales bacterium]|nr:DUF1761 domain-containing protein [Candidatus Nanopelagicales bacterium]MCF8536890.1 DUF1761 domain-containing protein [Candidatus Nanopelagicales bacterium]MCF8542020.1 DUF1761 domain-containing protein [Candidatus Nanopelagicales bacterium]MCF8556708.1 DUF1761 domain-containing protein [Candidatus Nanopelagicales bacterium]
MNIPSILWWSPLLGAVLAFLVNWAWFGPKTFYPAWMRALGRDPSDPSTGQVSAAQAFGGTVIALLVQAYGLAIVIALREASGTDVGPLRGLVIGALIGVLFVAPASLGHRLFSGQGFKVWAIECGGDIAGLASIGLVIGLWH